MRCKICCVQAPCLLALPCTSLLAIALLCARACMRIFMTLQGWDPLPQVGALVNALGNNGIDFGYVLCNACGACFPIMHCICTYCLTHIHVCMRMCTFYNFFAAHCGLSQVRRGLRHGALCTQHSEHRIDDMPARTVFCAACTFSVWAALSVCCLQHPTACLVVVGEISSRRVPT